MEILIHSDSDAYCIVFYMLLLYTRLFLLLIQWKFDQQQNIVVYGSDTTRQQQQQPVTTGMNRYRDRRAHHTTPQRYILFVFFPF